MTEKPWQHTFFQLRDDFIKAQYPHLNDAQKEAVLHVKGPSLVLAGAGSGKTTMLVNRISHLLRFGPVYGSESIPDGLTEEKTARLKQWMEQQTDLSVPVPLEFSRVLEPEGIDPYRILAITFTNKAAREMKERVQKLMRGRYDAMWLNTFHAACARMLRRDIHHLGYGSNFVIYDTQDQKIVIKECLKNLNLSEKEFAPGMISGWISKRKDEMVTPKEWLTQVKGYFWQEKMGDIYELYEKKLKTNNALDFDDLILKTLNLFEAAPDVLRYYQERFQYILVDEFQDTNRPQYLWVRALAGKHGNLCVVGDDDQSIYGWRGADIENILGFERDFPDTHTVKLEQNYRSTVTILEAANQVVAKNKLRKDKKLFTEGEKGERLIYRRCTNEYDEADFLATTMKNLLNEGYASHDFAVLYRTHAQSRVLEEALMKSGIAYRIYGGTRYYDRKEIRDILAYLKVIENPKDAVSLKRIVNVPKRGIGDKTVEQIESVAVDHDRTLYEVLSEPDLLALAGGRAMKKLTDFTAQLSRWIDMKNSVTVTSLTEQIYEETGLVALLRKEGSVEALGRAENLMEFLSLTKEYDEASDEKTLEAFLAGTSLEASVDEMDEADPGALLMTLHSAKGLEFPVVFMPGMEENLFPSPMSLRENNEEEERRLCYVGLTRAKEKLFLSNAQQRTIFGRTNVNPPSRFLDEIPDECMTVQESTATGTGSNRSDRWSRRRFSSEAYEPFGKLPEADTRNSVPKSAGSFGSRTAVKAGSHVRHPSFGKGTVVACDDSVATIAFPDNGIKKINMDYVTLTVEE